MQEAKLKYEKKVIADEVNNKMFVEEVGRHRDYREKARLDPTRTLTLTPRRCAWRPTPNPDPNPNPDH